MLKGAIIGFGEVAQKGHWPGYQGSRDAKIIAVVDRTEQRRDVAEKIIPGVATYSTIEELAEGAEIDFVDICTPPALHSESIFAALSKKWHVLCEKPLLLDLDELEKVKVAAKKAERAVVPVHNWKYAPIIRQATASLRSGVIGRLRALEMETLRIQDCAVADPEHPNWRRDPEISGGGILMDHGWHAVYLARHWFGEEPANVRGYLRRLEDGGVEDEVALTLNFTRGNAKIFLTWRADKRRNTIHMIGERGTITIGDTTLTAGNSIIHFPQGLSTGSHHPDWFAAMLPDVFSCFQDSKKADDLFLEAALCLSVIRRMYAIA